MNLIRLAIHGGAGVIDRKSFSAEREAAYRAELARIVGVGLALLKSGASALDAVTACICELEDCEYFNAGRGAVLNARGEAEMDASIMDGRDRSAGGVGAVRTPRNPIMLARAVMAQGDHVLLVGPNADAFAEQAGVVQAPADYFVLPARLEQLAMAVAAGRISLDHDEHYAVAEGAAAETSAANKMGTVGAVARDAVGNLSAGTSSGGMTNKLPGRVGDTPIIGAGTWADNSSVAVSATGHGEFFLRSSLAHDLHARIAYANTSLRNAADAVLAEVKRMGGAGGLIAIDRHGDIALPFNSSGMYRAWVGSDEITRVAIYRE